MFQARKTAAGLAVIAALFVASASSKPKTLCTGFLPENDLQILENDPTAAGISEEQFNGVLDRVEKLYAPVIAAKGAKLAIKRMWSNGTVNASAYQSGGNWYLNMYGGLARHKTITVEGFALVACHELGHHLGGFPKYGGNDWATNEGGADYYATLKCLRHVFQPGEAGEPVDPVAEKACKQSFSEDGARSLCGKGTMAGVSVANLFQALSPRPSPPNLTTPDPSVVPATRDSHPVGQCRLDTYFAGAVCTAKLSVEQSDEEPVTGACTAKEGFTIGLRPLCWYKPPEGQGFNVAEGAGAAPLELPDAKTLQLKLDAVRAALSGRGI